MTDVNRAVLIVDDELFSIRAYVDRLIDEGFTVLLSDNAEQAAERVRSGDPISAVIIDWKMALPETAHGEGYGRYEGGLWLLEQLAPRIAARSIVAIVLTHLPVASIISRMKERGLDHADRVRSKRDIPPDFLPRLITRAIAESTGE